MFASESSQQNLSFISSTSNQTYFSAVSTLPNSTSSQSFASSLYPSQSFISSGSTEISHADQFKYNLEVALDRLTTVSMLARNSLERIEKAYHQDVNPVHTSADLAGLKQQLLELTALLEHSGVGALPVNVAPSDPNIPQEQWLLQEITKSVQALYDKRKRIQDNHTVVASLLAVPESSRK